MIGGDEGGLDRGSHVLRVFRPDQHHCGSTEAAARHPRPQSTGSHGGRHYGVQLQAGDLEVFAQRLVSLQQRSAHTDVVALAKGTHDVLHPLILCHDMVGSSPQTLIWQTFQILEGHRAQRVVTQRRRGSITVGPSGGESAIVQGVSHPGVHHQQREAVLGQR